jgi:DNA polymerase epsilon subunit 3
MAEKADDLKLPLANVSRVIKSALGEGVFVSKEARTAIARAASVFVLHATNFANESAQLHKRRTIGSQDVLTALAQLECDTLVEPVKHALAVWRTSQQQRRDTQRAAKRARTDTTEDGTADDGDDDHADSQIDLTRDNEENVAANE